MGVNAVLPRPDIAQATNGLKGPDHQHSETIKAQAMDIVSGLARYIGLSLPLCPLLPCPPRSCYARESFARMG